MISSLLLAIAPSVPTDVVPPTLSVTDVAFGTTAPAGASSHLGLVPGHTPLFRAESAAAGKLALLFASPSKLATPIVIGSWALYLDPATAFLIAQGPVDATGAIDWPLAVPGSLPLGVPLFTQAALVDPAAGGIQLTNALDHVVTDASANVLTQVVHSSHPLSFEFGGGTLLVQSQGEWQTQWAAAGMPGMPPVVDFTRDVVVMHFAGTFGTSGYSVVVEGATPLAPGAFVAATLTAPDPSCPVTFGFTHPACFATLDRVAGGTPFQVQQATVTSPPCP